MRKLRRLSDYARVGIDHKGNLKGLVQSINNATIDNVKQLLVTPESNFAQIGAYLEDLAKKNGTVNSVINYFSSMLTLNHSISPIFDTESESLPAVTIHDYLGAAKWINGYKLNYWTPYFIRQTLIHGSTYYYELKDESGVSYIEFPSSMGRIYANENGVSRWALDISAIKKEVTEIEGFPEEIASAFNSGNRSGEDFIDGKYLKLGDSAFAFTFNLSATMKNGGMVVSELLPLITDSLIVEKAKENVMIKDDIDTVRFLWGKVPTDKDGVPMMAPEEIEEWQSLFESGLPDGVVSVVTPFDIQGINLSNTGNKRAYETVQDAQVQLYSSAGVSSEMISGNTKSSRILELSIAKDEAWVFSFILPVIEAYYNYVMSQYQEVEGVAWELEILKQTVYNKDKFIANAKEVLAMGGSRGDYLAATGQKPYQAYSKLIMEQEMLKIDNWMVPKATSHTMSGTEDTGRPSSDTVTEDTERIQDSQ